MEVFLLELRMVVREKAFLLFVLFASEKIERLLAKVLPWYNKSKYYGRPYGQKRAQRRRY